MILSAKIIKALKSIVQTDKLNKKTTGINLRSGNKLDATNGSIAMTIDLPQPLDDESYEFKQTGHYPLPDVVNIGPEIFDAAKIAKKSDGVESESVLIRMVPASDPDGEDRLIAVVNKNSVFDTEILQPFPDIDSVVWDKIADDSSCLRTTFNIVNFMKILTAFKDLGATYFNLRLPLTNSFTVFEGKSYTDHIFKARAVIMNASDPERPHKIYWRYNFKLECSGYADYESPVYDSSVRMQYELEKYVGENYRRSDVITVTVINYSGKQMTNAPYVYEHPVEEIAEDDAGDDKLTPEEEDALNELMDGPGSSDSEVVQLTACQAADESISRDEKIGKLYKNADKSVTEEVILSERTEESIPVSDDNDGNYDYSEHIPVMLASDADGTEAEKLEFLWKAGKSVDDLIEIFSRGEKIYSRNDIIDALDFIGMDVEDIDLSMKLDTHIKYEGDPDISTTTDAITETFEVWDRLQSENSGYIVAVTNKWNAYNVYGYHADIVAGVLQVPVSTADVNGETINIVGILYRDRDDFISKILKAGYKVLLADRVERKLNDKDLYPNHGKRWSADDDEKLEFLFKAGKSVEDLSEIFGRKPDGIVIRLQKMNLIEGGTKKQTEIPADESAETVSDAPDKSDDIVTDDNGFKPFVLARDKSLLKPGSLIIIHDEDTMKGYQLPESMKLIHKTRKIYGETHEIKGLYSPVGVTSTEFEYYVIPYAMIKAFK